ncbi:fumarate/nitrate reduction transcriptional regulator Fnr [Sulfuriflexus sp.]|uniref:fumarate/nitrate reduction transcriptional regulator Fnr n=1 Tax=Sulfuriflexus sp. TaxID=2015443 RepID=UPI0028CE3399|nr:fumarate/nitrate reduction transcriptional regulator Fnr [Sulfuriflexus sp.]MDT8404164.1 fumarate/nitrate reduction transcriptional regulator Fnr [Sulfuriflexus sp.]
MSKPTSTDNVFHVKPACEDCGVRRLCLPVSLEGEALTLMDRLVKRRTPLKKGDYIYRTGDRFHSLYALQYGAIKSYGLTVEGKEQITGFHLTGEVLGLDAIDSSLHSCNAVALEKTEICELPFDALEQLEKEVPSLQHDLACIMSREIRRDQGMLMMIGGSSAEQRLARFLLNLRERMLKRGFDGNQLRLPMTRQDIGNYLGLAFETISRQLAHLQEIGMLEIDNKTIRLLDISGLESLAA